MLQKTMAMFWYYMTSLVCAKTHRLVRNLIALQMIFILIVFCMMYQCKKIIAVTQMGSNCEINIVYFITVKLKKKLLVIQDNVDHKGNSNSKVTSKQQNTYVG